ncbi:MAG: selenocysteine-specific translation elongation factor [Chloroflexi bacterium]|nr:selenocysteine-specific translation elongation factor [Chloroflexota bacterium]
MRVIGTAGHVDHGKSTLVLTLTGIDPDRLQEEKQRQMTIDLGFAWLTLPSGERVGIVDVPGHKDFIKNMLAGVGGIDAALLIVAADEGVMPQTREHLFILDVLQVRHGVVALTKIDMVDDQDWLELVEADLHEVLEATTLHDAPIVHVSAKTGQGVPELIAALDQVLQAAAPRRDVGRPRLPVDRIFTVAGFGTVVTGTLVDGSLQVGQEVELQPSGVRTRIRGLQSYKQKVDLAQPGSRVAVNLVGSPREQVARGEVLTTPGWLRATRLVDVWLEYQSETLAPLKHGQPVEVFCGSAESLGRVRLLDAEQLRPGQGGWAQLRLESPMALVRGDRFIIRRPSPSETVGGGLIVQPHPARMHRRFQAATVRALEVLRQGSPEELLLQAAEQAGPLPVRDLVERAGLGKDETLVALDALLADGRMRPLSPEPDQPATAADLAAAGKLVLSRSTWLAMGEKLEALLEAYHRSNPLRQGMPREELKSRLGLSPRLFAEALAVAAQEGRVELTETTARLPSHQVCFSPQQEQAIADLLTRFQRQPYAPPPAPEAEAALGPDLLSALVEQGRLTRLSDDVLLLPATYEEMTAKIVDYLKANGSITVAQVRDLFDTSRRYALALLGHLDEKRVTRRVGDERFLR